VIIYITELSCKRTICRYEKKSITSKEVTHFTYSCFRETDMSPGQRGQHNRTKPWQTQARHLDHDLKVRHAQNILTPSVHQDRQWSLFVDTPYYSFAITTITLLWLNALTREFGSNGSSRSRRAVTLPNRLQTKRMSILISLAGLVLF